MEQGGNVVQWVYSSKNSQELEDRYDQWAKTYETDLEQDFEWHGPRLAGEVLAKYVPKDSEILDAGVGTGLVGHVLSRLGYRNLIGIDLSPGMLEEASTKNLYQDLHRMVMGEHLDFPTDSFTAVISVGVFTVGHAPVGSFDELVRVTKPGGYIVFTLRPDLYEEGEFKEKQEALEAEGKWKLVEKSESIQLLPRGEPDVFHQIWVYQITA